ncbi:MAG: hypothetical protein JNL42_21960 [Anaerolineae bacterium]|nr:hypothetical protein [Anaerolineae bacterium]
MKTSALRRGTLALSLIAAALLIGIIPVGAQSADPALIALVAGAFETTLARSSMHIQSQTATESAAGQGGGFQSTGSAAYDLAQTADGWNLSGSRTTSSATPNGAFETTTAIILLDGVVYRRVEGDAGFGPPTGGTADSGAAAPTTPEGWAEVGAQEDVQSGGRGGMIDAGDALGVLLLPISAESVTSIAELPGDTLEGQAMRIFQVTIDPQAVIESGMSGLMGGGFAGGGPGAGGFPPGAEGTPMPPAGDAGQAPPADAPEGALAGALSDAEISLTFAVYIGVEDGLVHRVYSVVDAAGGGGVFTTRTTSVTDFSAFDVPVTITAPVIGS